MRRPTSIMHFRWFYKGFLWATRHRDAAETEQLHRAAFVGETQLICAAFPARCVTFLVPLCVCLPSTSGPISARATPTPSGILCTPSSHAVSLTYAARENRYRPAFRCIMRMSRVWFGIAPNFSALGATCEGAHPQRAARFEFRMPGGGGAPPRTIISDSFCCHTRPRRGGTRR